MAVWVLAIAAPAGAQTQDRSILLLMDGSKSMNRPAGGGLTRLDAAKKAVQGLLVGALGAVAVGGRPRRRPV